MGGSAAMLAASVFTQVASTAISSMNKPKGPPDNSAQLAEERKAREAEQTQQEADERKRQRGKVTEARQLEKKRLSPTANRQTTLAGGGGGMKNNAKIASPGLKTKLGE